jgi:Tfp pilus assembly protein PilO
MTEVEQSVLRTLVDLHNAVKAMPTANPKPNLMSLFSRLDQLMRQLPRDADPNLLHYLHKKSYEKARLLLEGRGAENTRGSCR